MKYKYFIFLLAYIFVYVHVVLFETMLRYFCFDPFVVGNVEYILLKFLGSFCFCAPKMHWLVLRFDNVNSLLVLVQALCRSENKLFPETVMTMMYDHICLLCHHVLNWIFWPQTRFPMAYFMTNWPRELKIPKSIAHVHGSFTLSFIFQRSFWPGVAVLSFEIA